MPNLTGPRSRHNPAPSAEETTWLLDQRLKGYTVRQISAMCPEGIGRPLSPSQVHKRIEKVLTKRQEPSLEAVRKMELDRLDDLEQRMRAILARHHVTIHAGTIVKDSTGEPLLDDGPWMAAADRLLKIGERRSRLKGLDAPVQVQQETTVEYRIVGVDPSALT